MKMIMLQVASVVSLGRMLDFVRKQHAFFGVVENLSMNEKKSCMF